LQVYKGIAKFKDGPLQNEEEKIIMFEDIRNTGDNHSLLENRSIVTVKYGCNRVIFVAIPSNNNNVTLVKSGSK
jgi:hypothetical protein